MEAEILSWFIDHLDYWVIILFMAIESSFIPFPSEVVVPPAAFFAAAGLTGMQIPLIVVCATIGALIGSLINYYLALWLGKPIVYGFANSKIGHMCLLDEAKIKNAEDFFNRHGAIATFTGRLVPAVRQLISIPAGLAGMSMPKFLGFTALGAGIWNGVLAAMGYYLYSSGIFGEPRDNPSDYREDLLSKVDQYSSEIKVFILGIIAIICLYGLFSYVKRQRSRR